MNPENRPSMIDNLRTTSNVLSFITSAFTRTLTVFFHKGHGSQYLGLEAALAVPLILVFAVFWPGHDLQPLMVFLWAYLGACLFARLKMWGAESRGEIIHSRYDGRPRLMSILKTRDELSIKGTTEPAIALAIGFVTLMFNQPLGMFLVLAAFAQAINVSMVAAYEKAQTRQSIDSMIEARQHTDRVREAMGRM